MIQLPDSLVTAYENLLRVIPKPLTAEEETERVRTCRECPDVDPTALHDGARRFVEELSRLPEARAEIERRSKLCVQLTGANTSYSTAKTKAIETLCGWMPTDPILQKLVGSLQHRGGQELVADVRGERERLERLLNYENVPDATRTVLEAWRDAAWSIISKGENESLDGCYRLLHAEKLQYALFVPAAAPEVRQASDALVGWLRSGGNSTSSVQDDDYLEKWSKKARDLWKWAKSKWWLAAIIAVVLVLWKIIEFVVSIRNFIPDMPDK